IEIGLELLDRSSEDVDERAKRTLGSRSVERRADFVVPNAVNRRKQREQRFAIQAQGITPRSSPASSNVSNSAATRPPLASLPAAAAASRACHAAVPPRRYSAFTSTATTPLTVWTAATTSS